MGGKKNQSKRRGKKNAAKQTSSPNAPPKPGRPKDFNAISRRADLVSDKSGVDYLRGFNSNPTSSEKEIRMTLTDYFDSSGDIQNPYNQYLFDTSVSLFFADQASGTATITRPTGFRLYALPAFSGDTSTSSVLVAFTLPTESGKDGESASACQRTTLLTPTSVSDWVLCGIWSANTVFDNSMVVPAVNGLGNTALGTWATLQPDSLTPSNAKVQFRAEIDVACALPLVSVAKYGIPVSNNSALWSGAAAGANTAKGPVLAKIKGISNST